MKVNPEAVIFMGVQATGKSTFYAERFSRPHLRVNLDMLRTRSREKLIVRACLEAKQSFVVDNTNPTGDDRSRYLELGRERGFRMIGYYFQSKIEDALRRNAAREEDERVPDVAVRGTHTKLETPALDEGFDELFYVTLNNGGGFSVQPWSDEV